MKDHPIRAYMTTVRFAVAPGDPITRARELMQANAIRHLPVVDADGAVVGIVSIGDLYATEAIAELDPDRTEVEHAMSQDVYTVGPDTPLAEVAEGLAERHVGSAVVVEGGRLVGLFTGTDALRVLARVLRGERG